MNVSNNIELLKTEVSKTLEVLGKSEKLYDEMKPLFSDKNDLRNGIVLAEIFVNYYTCLETVFFRISSFFENNLSKEKWHSELLRKMTLEIEGIRPRAISDSTYRILDEFRRFRHFKRYYYDFNYDWDKLEFLQKKFETLSVEIKNDLSEFISFLNNLDAYRKR